MCGIVAYRGSKEAREVLLEGLKKLEYRGYDSSGLAILNNGDVNLVRSVGKLAALEEELSGAVETSRFSVAYQRSGM